MDHPVASHPFSHGVHPQHSERLAAYLSEAFGGPQLYSAGYGSETQMQRIHAGNGEHHELDEYCIALFEQALNDANLDQDTIKQTATYFRTATEGQRAYKDSPEQVPEDLPFNRA